MRCAKGACLLGYLGVLCEQLVHESELKENS